jgi:cysteine sulfinate desulfinase/cysteine desulfurase-like protein
MRYTLKDRSAKNTLLRQFTTNIITALSNKKLNIITLSPTDYHKTLPNTLLILVKYKTLRESLEQQNIIVNDMVDQHVLDAIGVPRELHANVLRISFADSITPLEASKLLDIITALDQ